jgi:hypothetical protein
MKSILKTGLMVVAGLAVLAPVAQAADFHVILTNQPGATGSYSVDVHTSDFVNFYLDNLKPNRPPDPSSFVDRFTLTFYKDTNLGGGGVNVDLVTGTSGTDAGTRVNWGAADFDPSSNTVDFDGKFSTRVKFDGTNDWAMSAGGLITLDSKAGSIDILGQDGGQWRTTLNLVPEASSVALLLPGLIPMGLVMRRRNMARKSSSA